MKRLLLITMLLSAIPVYGNGALLQVQTNTNASGTAVTVNITTGTPRLLVMECGENNTATATMAVTDSASNSWTQAGTYASSGTNRAGMFFSNSAAAITSATCTWTGGGIVNTRVPATIFELSGMATSSVVDIGNSQNSASATSISSGLTSSTTASDIILFSMVNINCASPPCTGDTVTASFVYPSNGFGNRIDGTCGAFTGTGVHNPTMSWSTAASVYGNIEAFKIATGTATCAASVTPNMPPVVLTIFERCLYSLQLFRRWR